MKVIQKNTRVNLATGERFDTVIGNGERIEVPQQSPFTPEQLACFRDYEREMHERVIPEIERVMRMRHRLAEWSRRQFV